MSKLIYNLYNETEKKNSNLPYKTTDPLIKFCSKSALVAIAQARPLTIFC